ncbi:MAG: 30S ribosome-binding factor RbfA [Buchnera aphidicola (Nurudea yanoniella)]
MLQSNRFFRISKEIQKEISWIIQNSLEDPRLKSLITVLEVQTSRDFNYSKVYISIFDKNEKLSINVNNVVLTLQKSASYIRYLLAKRVHFRNIPFLKFFYDNSLVKGIKMNKLINKSCENKRKILKKRDC